MSLGFAVLGLILFTSSQVAGGIALGVAALTGIVSLASKKRSNVQKKKLRKLLTIIGILVLAGFLIGTAIALAAWRGH